MAIFADLVDVFRSGFRAERDPLDERFWGTDGFVGVSSSGMLVTQSQALRVSCLFQGIRLISETVGSVPLILYRETDDGIKSRAKDHFLWRTLRRQANRHQTAQQFRESMTAWALLEGISYAPITVDPATGRVELTPIEPNLVTTEELTNGRLRYRIQGQEETIPEEKMFTLHGLGLHRFMPLSLLNLARETIGIWLAQEKFRATYFASGATPGIWLKHKKKLSKEVYDRLKETAAQRYTGPRSWHKVQIAEEDMDVTSVGFNAKDSQMTEAGEAIVLEVARWINCPPHMLRSSLLTATFASIEQFAREFVDYTIRPWFVRWEQSIDRDLLDDEDLYAEHLMDALLRGNTLDRAQADQIYVNSGVKTRNEVRRQENLNPLDGLDEPLTPLNMERTGPEIAKQKPTPRLPARKPSPPDDDEEQRVPRRVGLIVQSAAGRVVRKETSAIAGATKLAADPPAWRAWVSAFYEEHAAFVAQALELEPSIAQQYSNSHRDALLAAGVAAAEGWLPAAVEELTRLALELKEEPAHA